MAQVTCWKCGGSGYIPKYKNIQNGICFACNGTGVLDGTQTKRISIESFEKGTKKGGKTKFLFEVDPKDLDRKQLEKFRTRIKTRSNELGVKLKAGFTTETALRKLWEAYKEQNGDKEHTGNRFESAKKVEKPKKEETAKVETSTTTAKKEEPKKEEPKKTPYEEIEKLFEVDVMELELHERVKVKAKLREIASEYNLDHTGSARQLQQRLSEAFGFPIKQSKKEVKKIDMPDFQEMAYSRPSDFTFENGERTGNLRHPDKAVLLGRESDIKKIREFVNQDVSNWEGKDQDAYEENLEKTAQFLGLRGYKVASHAHLVQGINKELDFIATGKRNREVPKKETSRPEPSSSGAGGGTATATKTEAIVNPILNPGITLDEKTGDYKNTKGHIIKNPYKYGDSDFVKANSVKPLGDPVLKANNISEDLDPIRRRFGDEVYAEAKSQIEDVFESVSRKHGALISNVGLGNIHLALSPSLPWNGIYTFKKGDPTMAIGLNVNRLIQKVASKKHFPTEESYRREVGKIKGDMQRVLVHELSHAYHHQVLSNRVLKHAFTSTASSEPSIGNDIQQLYLEKLRRLVGNGVNPSILSNAYKGSGSPKDNELILKEFPKLYGASAPWEMFATASEGLNDPVVLGVIENRMPDLFALIIKAYKGVYKL